MRFNIIPLGHVGHVPSGIEVIGGELTSQAHDGEWAELGSSVQLDPDHLVDQTGGNVEKTAPGSLKAESFLCTALVVCCEITCEGVNVKGVISGPSVQFVEAVASMNIDVVRQVPLQHDAEVPSDRAQSDNVVVSAYCQRLTGFCCFEHWNDRVLILATDATGQGLSFSADLGLYKNVKELFAPVRISALCVSLEHAQRFLELLGARCNYAAREEVVVKRDGLLWQPVMAAEALENAWAESGHASIALCVLGC